MKLRVLGCAGAEFPGFSPPAFLVDQALLLDAGTIGTVLNEAEQAAIRHVLITHSHLDHVRGLPALADNVVVGTRDQHISVASTADVLAVLKEHLLNGVIWPDFSVIPNPASPVVSYRSMQPGKEVFFDGYSVTAYEVNHSVPAVGFLVRKGGKAILYTGDTGPTDGIWEAAGLLSALIVEVSFPNDMEEMALLTGHLTSRLLAVELGKLQELPPRILISHPKPQFYETIAAELKAMGLPQIDLLRDGDCYEL